MSIVVTVQRSICVRGEGGRQVIRVSACKAPLLLLLSNRNANKYIDQRITLVDGKNLEETY